jgi:hypothetical protein
MVLGMGPVSWLLFQLKLMRDDERLISHTGKGPVMLLLLKLMNWSPLSLLRLLSSLAFIVSPRLGRSTLVMRLFRHVMTPVQLHGSSA